MYSFNQENNCLSISYNNGCVYSGFRVDLDQITKEELEKLIEILQNSLNKKG